MPSTAPPSRDLPLVRARSLWLALIQRGLIFARWPLLLVAVTIGLVVFLVGLLLDTAVLDDPRPIFHSDAFAGVVAALLSYQVLRYYATQRRDALERLRVIGEVNHHVRNALTAILYSVNARRDPELISITEAAVQRIDWVLHEVLGGNDPQVSPGTRKPPQVAEQPPARRATTAPRPDRFQ